MMQNAVPFTAQLRNLFRYRRLLRTLLGPRRAERLVNRATFVVSTGTNDMLSVYLAAANNNRSSAIVSTEAYENYLISRVANYTQVYVRFFLSFFMCMYKGIIVYWYV
jgi:hypothetical protein